MQMSNKAVYILHLDDDQEWRDNVRLALDGNSYFFAYAKNVSDAKRVYGELAMAGYPPQLVILDISMAFEDANDTGGFRFVEELRSWGFTDKTAVIVLSGFITSQNLLNLFQDYKVEVEAIFDKGNFSEDIEVFQKIVAKCVTKMPLLP
jgi:CheY-like chemotaxis protein